MSTNSVQSFSQPLRSPSRLGSAGGNGHSSQDAEIARLKHQLSERDRRLDEQAVSLAEMEASVKELSSLMPPDGITPGSRKGSLAEEGDDKSASQLRQMLREKNEKISMLTAEFDAHRADFRSTLDSLEMASTETERVYEEQKRDLQERERELLEQLAEAQEMGQSKEDFEGVAQQLKQLEELVAELEEGLEESRRGEAEARGEVEFLRGEVERGRSELKREREKSAAALRNTALASPKEVEQRDDEIRGLKAIIHSLSSSPNVEAKEKVNGYIANEDEVTRLQKALDERDREKDALERELEQLRRDCAMTNGNGNGNVNHTRNESEMTATPSPEKKPLPNRTRSGTVKATFAEHARRNGVVKPEESPERDAEETEEAEEDGLFCEMCESNDHDTLECTNLRKVHSREPAEDSGDANESDAEEPGKAAPRPVSLGKENKVNGDAGKGEKVQEEDKWCALCEKDGHLAFDCPEEQY